MLWYDATNGFLSYENKKEETHYEKVSRAVDGCYDAAVRGCRLR
jgi:hypothetical protein